MASVGAPQKADRTKVDLAIFVRDEVRKFRTENPDMFKGSFVDLLGALALAGTKLPPTVVRELVEIYKDEDKKHVSTRA